MLRDLRRCCTVYTCEQRAGYLPQRCVESVTLTRRVDKPIALCLQLLP